MAKKRRKPKLRIIGCDPGFANIGLAALDLYTLGDSTIQDTLLVTTKKDKGKVKIIDDELRRLKEIEDKFIAFIDKWLPDVVAIEEPGKCLMRRGSRWETNPQALRSSCLMWGSISGICRARRIYIVKYSSKEIKRAVCGKASASKKEMEKEVKGRYRTYKNWQHSKKVEHEVDAVGAAITAFKEPFVMALLRKLSSDDRP